jgi:hypothetical protein
MEEEKDVYGQAFGWRHDIEDDGFRKILSSWQAWRRHPDPTSALLG